MRFGGAATSADRRGSAVRNGAQLAVLGDIGKDVRGGEELKSAGMSFAPPNPLLFAVQQPQCGAGLCGNDEAGLGETWGRRCPNERRVWCEGA